LSGCEALAIPDHSLTPTAADLAALRLTVTLVTVGAPTRYQISTRELMPVRYPTTGAADHVPPEESLTVFTFAELPAARATTATSVSPGSEALGSAAVTVPVLPPVWVS
jgi:hypothetical protein